MSSRAQTASSTCPECGGIIPAGLPFGQCPRCLLKLGLVFPPESAPVILPLPSTPKAEWDYEILEQIGRGGMGVVYRARQRSLNRTVAIKMIALGDFASPSALARLRREAETAAKLEHPNIVPIIEVGEREANPFLVLRYVPGDSLAGRIREFSVPSTENSANSSAIQNRIARLLATIARAVDYAHNRGVLHRDLKPSNILLDLEDQPHVTDFGLAKSADHDAGLTQTSELLGTLCYMSPEQAAGLPVSRASDVYSIGAILYELLTGRPPFNGLKMETLQQVLHNDPAPPRWINPAVDRDLATICLKCLDKSPQRRYSSALELAEDLERWLRHEPILAREAGAAIRFQRWTRRNPAVATLLFSLTVGITVCCWLLARAYEEENRKSIALDILRAESARQLQEIWSSAHSFFAVKSETLSAMAGMELISLPPVEERFTIALVSEGNPLDRILRAAPVFQEIETALTATSERSARLDLRLYKDHSTAIDHLVRREIDFAQLNPRELLRARERDAQIQALITIVPAAGYNDSAVIFARRGAGVTNLAGLQGKSFLFGSPDSTLSFCAKVALAQAGVRGRDLAKWNYLQNASDLYTDGRSGSPAAPANRYSSMTPVEAVLSGLFDAAVVRERRFREVALEEDLVLLHRFKEPGDFIAARGDLPSKSAATFRRTLASLQVLPSDQTFLPAPAQFKAASAADLAELLENLPMEAAFHE